MDPLLAIVLFTGVLGGIATAYRVVEKRSAKRNPAPKQIDPSTGVERSTDAPPTSITTPVPPNAPPEPPTTVAEPQPVATVPSYSPPVIPDPWISESEATIDPSSETGSPIASEPVTPLSVSSSSADLKAAINRVGQSGQVQQTANLLRYANHSDSAVRASVATALGKLAKKKSGKSSEGMIPTLGRLSQDANSEVRLAAIQALGYTQSPKALPWLQQAQKTTSGEVGKAVTIALQNLKLIYQPKPKPPINAVKHPSKNKKF